LRPASAQSIRLERQIATLARRLERVDARRAAMIGAMAHLLRQKQIDQYWIDD